MPLKKISLEEVVQHLRAVCKLFLTFISKNKWGVRDQIFSYCQWPSVCLHNLFAVSISFSNIKCCRNGGKTNCWMIFFGTGLKNLIPVLFPPFCHWCFHNALGNWDLVLPKQTCWWEQEGIDFCMLFKYLSIENQNPF